MVYGALIERKYFNRKEVCQKQKDPKFRGQAKKKYICHIKPTIDIAKSFCR